MPQTAAVTTSLWGPDGQWVGASAPAPPPPGPTTGDKVWARLGTGCLTLLGLALLLPALLLGVWATISATSPATATAPAVVLAVGPGTDEQGRARPYCYTVEYDVDRPRTYRTCDVSAASLPPPRPGEDSRAETHEEEERRFAAEHPVGSRVEVLHEVDDPGEVDGGISDPEVFRSGGSPTMTVVTGAGAALFVAGALFALRGARRAWRASLAPGA